MRKKAFLLLSLTLIGAMAFWKAISLANASQPDKPQVTVSPTVYARILDARQQLFLTEIAQRNQERMDIEDTEIYNLMDKYINYPDQATGIYQIAQAYSDKNKNEKALELFLYAAEAYPNNIYGKLSQMMYDALNHNYDAVNVVAESLLAVSSNNEDVKQGIYDLADFYRKNKEYERAIYFYQVGISTWNEYDDLTNPYREIAYSYIDMSEIEIARLIIAEMQEELAYSPNLASNNFKIANYYLSAGNSADALDLHQYNHLFRLNHLVSPSEAPPRSDES